MVVSKLLKITIPSAYSIIKKYGMVSYMTKPTNTKIKLRKKSFRLPSNTDSLSQIHKNYLEERGFEVEKLEKEWNLLGTGVFSKLEDISYKNRIIIPFEWNGEMVSFDSRDITNKATNKYMACPKDREIIEHKTILYGNQKKWSDVGICVEGPTDVWRLGPSAFALSGIKYTRKQVREIRKAFKRVIILFDDDPQAIIQSHKLMVDLQLTGVEASEINIKGDPGSMSQEEANYLVKQIIR